MPPTILVTGATGGLGRHLIPELQRAGYKVRAQYRTRPGTLEGVDWRQMDFLETLDFSALVAGCDAVIHLAAETNNLPLMHRVNVEATAALVAAAQSAHARYFGHASSIVVYGSPTRRVVDETTPLLDPEAPLVRQYRNQPSMLEYARTKVLAERAIGELRPGMTVDVYRPTVVVDLDRMREAESWSPLRKLAFCYRQTQYIYVLDVAAAILHLMAQALGSTTLSRIEAFNFSDENCGTFRDILNLVHQSTGDRRYKPSVGLPMPMLLDMAKDVVKFRDPTLRYALGMLRFPNHKLRGAGFQFPHGMKSALRQSLARRDLAEI